MKTWLFVPGDDERKVRKALESSADVVIVDWEDAVADNRKAKARQITHELLPQLHPVPRVVLRINSRRSRFFEQDIQALEGVKTEAIVLAKVAQASDMEPLVSFGLPIVPIIESALGMENAFEIASAHPLIERLILGTMDLIADMGAQWFPDGEALRYIRGRMLMAGRAARLQGSIDGVYPLLGDLDGLCRETKTARELGYEGKLVIHPEQIDVVKDTFTPTQAEIEEARQVIIAWNDAQAADRSAIRLGEKFIDPPIVLWSQQVLHLAGEKTRE